MGLHLLKNLLLIALLGTAPLAWPQEESPSLTELRAAASRGQPEAQYELGILYEFGYNFPDNLVSAYAWYSRAADQGNAAATQRRDLLKQQLSATDLERAEAQARIPAASSSR